MRRPWDYMNIACTCMGNGGQCSSARWSTDGQRKRACQTMDAATSMVMSSFCVCERESAGCQQHIYRQSNYHSYCRRGVSQTAPPPSSLPPPRHRRSTGYRHRHNNVKRSIASGHKSCLRLGLAVLGCSVYSHEQKPIVRALETAPYRTSYSMKCTLCSYRRKSCIKYTLISV